MDSVKLKSLFVRTNVSLKDAMKKLNETAEKILLVVDEKETLLGTVSDGDIRRGIINGVELCETISSVMHKKFAAVTIDTPDMERRASGLMVEKEIGQIPVLDERGAIRDLLLWTDMIDGKGRPKTAHRYENQVVVMAGGRGSRLDPVTRILPKPLVPIGNRSIIEHIMERFYANGFYRFTYTLNYRKEYIKIFLRENQFPYNISWVEEKDFLGTAGSLSLLKDTISDTFFVTNCDSLLDVNFENILKWHKKHQASVTIIGCHHEFKIPFGVLECSNGRLEGISEKPVHDVIINTGVYVMEPHVISYIPDNTHLDMNKFFEMIMEKEKITVYPIIYGGWLDVGQWEEYRKSLKKIEAIEDV